MSERTLAERVADLEEAMSAVLATAPNGTSGARTPGQAAEEGHALLVAKVRAMREGDR